MAFLFYVRKATFDYGHTLMTIGSGDLLVTESGDYISFGPGN